MGKTRHVITRTKRTMPSNCSAPATARCDTDGSTSNTQAKHRISV